MADNLNYAIPANELFFYFLIYLGRIKYQFILLCTILSLIHFVFSNIKIAPLPHPPSGKLVSICFYLDTDESL